MRGSRERVNGFHKGLSLQTKSGLSPLFAPLSSLRVCGGWEVEAVSGGVGRRWERGLKGWQI